MSGDIDNPSYLAFLQACEKECRCCVDCVGGGDRPCAGVMAGGLCDQVCRCNDDEDGYYCDDEDHDA